MPKPPLETAAMGIADRGVLGVGEVADVNVIDFEALRPEVPTFEFDLPNGAPRWAQNRRLPCSTVPSPALPPSLPRIA